MQIKYSWRVPLLFFSALEYVQTNMAYPRSKGDLSILESQHVVGTAKCLRFSYKISGDDVGRLNVYIVSQDDSASLLWRISGSEGNEWKTAQVPIDVALGFKVTWQTGRNIITNRGWMWAPPSSPTPAYFRKKAEAHMAEVKLILRFGILFSRSGSAAVSDACKVNDKYLVVVVVCKGYCIFQTLNPL